MKDIEKMIADMPQEVYQRLVSAVEIGKWEDGTPLTDAQKASTQQVVILYQAKKMDQKDHFTINKEGAVNELSKAELKQQFRGETILSVKA